MNILLCQDVQNLGKIGQVLKVKDGYARNFLFPRKLAVAATDGNIKRIEQHKAREAALNDKRKMEAEQYAEKLSKVSCTLAVEVNDLEKLYGAVTEADIAQALAQEGHTVDRKNVVIPRPIDELGIFEIGVKLHPEVTAKVRLWVTKK